MPESTIDVGPEELRALLAITRRQFIWDARMPVRIVSTVSAIGLYTAPPLNVLALFAVPGVVSAPDGEPLDVVVTISSLVSELESASSSSRPLELERLSPASVPVTSVMSVAILPPTDGWQVPMTAVATERICGPNRRVRPSTTTGAGLPGAGRNDAR